MTRAKKVILALICAAALCCAAIGGVLLARPAAEVRAEVDDLAIASVDGQIYDINTIDEIKEMLTVERVVGDDGQTQPVSPEEFELFIYEQDGTTSVTMNEHGIFPESYFGTDGNRTSAEFTLVVTDTNKTASTTVTVQWAPDNAIAKMSIESADGAPTIYSYTDVSALEGSDYISVTVWTAAQVRSGSENGSPSYGFVSFSGDLSAPIEAVQDGKYEVELEAHYDGEILFNSYNYRVEVTAATPQSISYIRGSSSVHKLVDGESAPIVAGDTIKDIVKSDLHFNVFYASDTEGTVVRAVDGSDLHIVGYEYCNAAGEPLEGVNSFEWGENGNVYIKVTYQENGQPRSVRFNFQLARSPMTAPNIMATNEATAEELNASYGEARYDLLYQYSQEGEEGVKGSPWTISFDISTAIAAITKVTDEEGTPVNDVIAEGGGSVGLTDAGTYIISLTLQSGGYSWSVDNEMTSPDGMTITYTVVIQRAELVGTEFTFAGGWTYGEEANLPAEIKLVSRVDEDTTVSFAPPAGATIKVTFTGTPNGGTPQTYSYTYTQGSQSSPGTNVPSLAGSYKVYVEVTGMANYADVTFANSGTNEEFQQNDFTIARQGVTEPELTQEHYTYTGDTITAQYSPTTSEQWTASGETSAVNVQEGGYTIVFALNDSDNYCWGTDGSDDLADKTLTWYIDRADNEITGVDAPGWTYGGAIQLPAITASKFDQSDGLRDYSSASVTYTYDGGSFTATTDTLAWHAGTYGYTITYEGNDNINAATYTGTFTVAKGQAVIDGTPTIDGWTYGGTANTPSGVTGVTVSGTAITPRPGYYAYYGETNGGVSYGSNTEPVKDEPTDAGTYYVVYVVEGTDDYIGATAMSEEFIISRKQIAKPAYESLAGVSGNAYTSTYNAAQQSIDITGVDAILSIGGADASIASRTDTAVTLSAKNVKVSGGNASAYEVTFSFTDKNNYCWSGTADDVADVAFTWTIQKAENPITASDTYEGWSYGSTPTDVSALEAKAKYDNLTIEYAYYAADAFDETSGKPNSGAAEIEISATTPAGSYVLYLYHEGNDNTLAADKYFAFTISQATATISAAFADGDTLAWTYRDADSAHVLEVTVTVGDTTWQYWYRGETLQNKTEGSPEALVVQYLDESGNDVTSDVISDGMYQLPVGGYSVKVSLDTSAVGVSGNFTASEQTVTGISVSPFVVDIPTFTRENVFVEDTPWHPTVTNQGDRGAAWDIIYNEGNDSIFAAAIG